MDCERCKEKNPVVTTMSWFNTQIICLGCSKEELKHPDFNYARELESAEVRKGNYSYKGVGWPGSQGRVQKVTQ